MFHHAKLLTAVYTSILVTGFLRILTRFSMARNKIEEVGGLIYAFETKPILWLIKNLVQKKWSGTLTIRSNRHGNMKLNKQYFKRKYIILFCTIFIIAAPVTWYSVYILNGLPTLEQLENPKPELATKIYSADGEVLDQFAYKNRTRVTLNRLPPGLIKDLSPPKTKDFYDHWASSITFHPANGD